jgi:hypothetical protein
MDDQINEFIDILNNDGIDLDDIGLDIDDLTEMDTDDLNEILASIDFDDEDDEFEIYVGDPDEEEY